MIMQTKKIPLTKGKFAIVDVEDFKLLNQWRWNLHSTGYACRGEYGGIVNSKPKSITILMHRFIVGNIHNGQVDHINSDKLDNRKENLRICTSSQNKQNSKKYKSGVTSQYKGVCWNKRISRWQVEIQVNYVRYFLGHFIDESSAALAYNKFALMYHGKFFKFNIIENGGVAI